MGRWSFVVVVVVVVLVVSTAAARADDRCWRRRPEISIARAALRLIEGGGGRATAEAIAHILVVRTTAEEVRLEVAPGALAAARRRAIPCSIVKR